MAQPLTSLVVWSLLTTTANVAGLYLVRLWPAATRRRFLVFTAFSGGVVLGVSLLHLLPEATRHREDAGIYASLAFLSLYFFESHVRHRHGGGLAHATAHGALPRAARAAPSSLPIVDSEAHTVALMTAIAFALHSVTDGLALAVTFHDAADLGVATGLAVLAHEAPEGITVFTLLLYGGRSPRAATAYAWFVALTTPAVALATFFAAGSLPGEVLGVVLGLVAGSFLYIGATDLLPEIKRSPRLRTSLAVLAGVAVPLALRLAHVG